MCSNQIGVDVNLSVHFIPMVIKALVVMGSVNLCHPDDRVAVPWLTHPLGTGGLSICRTLARCINSRIFYGHCSHGDQGLQEVDGRRAIAQFMAERPP